MMGAIEIRATHPYGFRSGQWAWLARVEWFAGRACFFVQFPDLAVDHWPIQDPADPYEFRQRHDPTLDRAFDETYR
jgi:hypothetical protein